MADDDPRQRRQSSFLAGDDEIDGDENVREVSHGETDESPERGLSSRGRELTGNIADCDHECPRVDESSKGNIEHLEINKRRLAISTSVVVCNAYNNGGRSKE